MVLLHPLTTQGLTRRLKLTPPPTVKVAMNENARTDCFIVTTNHQWGDMSVVLIVIQLNPLMRATLRRRLNGR